MWIGNMIHERISSKALELRRSSGCLFFIVYSALYIDNVLLAAAVPVLPDFLSCINGFGNYTMARSTSTSDASSVVPIVKSTLHSINKSFIVDRTLDSITSSICATEDDLAAETAAYISAAKAFIQLLATPLVGLIVSKRGHRTVLSWAVCLLAVSCLVLCVASGTWHIILAKLLHGLASAGVAISALSSIAERYNDNEKLRTKIISRGMAAVAMGVL
ncbi:chromaffin granule amine transporter-like, partial [Tropilaelaps mercedesae]